MATLSEIWTLLTDPTLQQKVSAACMVAAEAIRTEDAGTANHANRLKWAKRVLNDHVDAGADMLKAVIAANASATLAQITDATDATIQAAVNGAVDIFADGL